MKLTYKVYKTIEDEKQIEIQDEKLICVEWLDFAGITHLTAFIETEPVGKADCKNRQITIRGAYLKIEKMVGSAVFNAKKLLSENKLNTTVSKELFTKSYNETLKRAFTEEIKKLEQ